MYTEGIVEAIEYGGLIIDMMGALVILGGIVWGLLSWVRDRHRTVDGCRAYRDCRQRIGRAIVLGLEILVASDIIHTVAVEPTFANAGVLAVLIVVRTFISWTLVLRVHCLPIGAARLCTPVSDAGPAPKLGPPISPSFEPRSRGPVKCGAKILQVRDLGFSNPPRHHSSPSASRGGHARRRAALVLRFTTSRCVAALSRRALPGLIGSAIVLVGATGDLHSATATSHNLGRREGMPSAQVHAVAEGPDGSMWAAGPSGLVRYDGVRIVVIGRNEGLSTQGLRALDVASDGTLWVGTDVGIDLVEQGGTIRPLIPPEQWSLGFVDVLSAGEEGLWIGASRGIARWTAAEGLQVEAGVPAQLVTAVLTAGNRTWCAGPTLGVRYGDSAGWHEVDVRLWKDVAPVVTLAAGPDTTLLVGGANGAVEIDWDAGSSRRVAGSTAGEAVTSALYVGDELWLGVAGQLRRYRGTPTGWDRGEVVLDGVLVNQILVDSNDNIWVATDGGGIEKISALRRAVSTSSQPCRTQVFAIAARRSGGFLVGGEQCSWSIGGPHEPAEPLVGLDRVKVWDIVEDGEGMVWAATERGLYSQRPDGVLVPTGLGGPVIGAPGRCLLDRRGELWVGTVAGLAVLRDGEVREITSADGSTIGYVYTLQEDQDGRLWVGTIGQGLWRETRPGVLEREAGEHLRAHSNVYSVAFDNSGRVAIVQDDRLVVLADDRSWEVVPEMPAPVAGWSATFGGDGSLWVGGSHGLVQYDVDGGRQMLRITSTMGLQGDEFTTSRSLIRDDLGRLLCGLDKGLSVVDPSALGTITSRPRVVLSGATWLNTTPVMGEGELTVESGRWTLDLALAAPWFVDERSLLYRHQLVGFDDTWSSPQVGGVLSVRYTALPAGSYSFRAQVFSPLFGWAPVADLLAFRVNPPWWRGPWILPLWAVGLAGSIAALLRWRTASLRAKARTLDDQVRQRTAELRAANLELVKLASHDHLTGLPNQRSFWRQAESFEGIARRRREPFGLIVMDLDRFKQVNDEHGHLVGDAALVHVARTLEGGLRVGDFLARYGGEEFVILLSHGPGVDFARVAERMRCSLEGSPFEWMDGAKITISASFGVSSWEGPHDTPEGMFRRADGALYRAKQRRNAVEVARNE